MARLVSAGVSLPYGPGKRTPRKKEPREAVAVVNRARKASEAAKTRAMEKMLTPEHAAMVGMGVRELAEQLKMAQGVADDTLDYYIDLYLGRVPLNIPPDKRYVAFDARSGRAPDIINRIMGLLGTRPAPIFVPPERSPGGVDAGQAIQRHLEGLDSWMRQQYGPVDDQAFFWQCLVGISYIQQTYLPAYWDKTVMKQKRKAGKEDSDEPDDMAEGSSDYENRRESYKSYMGPPMMRECLDPRIVWALPTPSGTHEWVKHYGVQRFELQQEFRHFGKELEFNEHGTVIGASDISGRPGLELPPDLGDAMTPIVDYYEYIDDACVYYVVDDVCVYYYEHHGGITIEPAHGIITGFKEWELQSTSVLFPVRNLLPQLDFLLTLWFNKAYIDVFPQLFEELGDDLAPTSKDQEAMTIEPMTIKPTRGKIMNPLAERESSMDFKSVYETVERDIDLATISGEVRGLAQSGQSGHAISQALDANKANWRNIPESRSVQWGNLYTHYIWCVKNIIKDEVSVYAVDRGKSGRVTGKYYRLKPDEIPDFYQVLADCEPRLPINAQGDMLAWMKAGAENMATDEEIARHGFRRNDWEDRRRQIDRDAFRRQAFPVAVEEAIKLGKVRLEGREAEILGIDKLNPLFQQPPQPQPTAPPPGMEQMPGAVPPEAAPALPPGPPAPVTNDMGANGVGLGVDNGIAPTFGASVNETGPRP